MESSRQKRCELVSYGLIAAFLLLVLLKGLLGALLATLLVYSLVHQLAPVLERRVSGERSRLVAVAVLGVLVVGVLTLMIWGLLSFFQSDAGSMQSLLKKLADIIDKSRGQFPDWLRAYLPLDADALHDVLAEWLGEHATEAKAMGAEVGRIVAHILVGMIIGAMLALHDSHGKANRAPLAAALVARMQVLYGAFRTLVFAQVWISAINATVIAIFVLVVLPLLGISLPLAKSLVAITFLAGLIPVLGNLISNTMFVIIGLSHSLHMAIAALVFMVVVHKLEYFLNARIIGSQIHAEAWELLGVLLVAETLFGLPGVVAAPIYYAYAKRELMALKLI
jgi:predicted PurR-regulated permease PerM